MGLFEGEGGVSGRRREGVWRGDAFLEGEREGGAEISGEAVGGCEEEANQGG